MGFCFQVLLKVAATVALGLGFRFKGSSQTGYYHGRYQPTSPEPETPNDLQPEILMLCYIVILYYVISIHSIMYMMFKAKNPQTSSLRPFHTKPGPHRGVADSFQQEQVWQKGPVKKA